MAKRGGGTWVNDMRGHPRIEGSLEISRSRYGVFVGGEPAALRSLAELLNWIADVDQDSLPLQPDGERFHVHLRAGRTRFQLVDAIFLRNRNLPARC